MKKVILSCLLLASLPNVVSANEVILNFKSTVSDGKVIKVTKTDTERVYSECRLRSETLDNDSCVEVNRITVKKFEAEKKHMSDSKFLSWEATPEIIGTTTGTFGGFIMGVFVAITMDGEPPQGKTSSKVAFALITATGMGLGYLLGDWVDGEEFTQLETAAIRATVGKTEILDQEFSGELNIEASLTTFRSGLKIASEVLAARN